MNLGFGWPVVSEEMFEECGQWTNRQKDGRWTDRACLYYEPTYEPIGSGELIKGK